MARAATSPELTLYRTPGKWSKYRTAIFVPHTIFTARINQTFTSLDSVFRIQYDTPVGSTSNVKPDMTALIGSSAGDYDIGICRVRAIDGTYIYIGETSEPLFADNQYLTIIDDYGLWARHVYIDDSEVVYMDGSVTYSDQHTNFEPTPIMGSHRVVKLTEATVSVGFNLSASYVVDGTSITGYSTSSPTALSVTNPTTSTPTVNIDSVGWHCVYSTIQAANGKTFMGVRYIYVWDDANPPLKTLIEEMHQDSETGGWNATLTVYTNASLTNIRERALVIVFAEDHFGTTQSDIGPVPGSENIEFIGWIGHEAIMWNPELGEVSFSAYGAHHWFQQIPSYPDGVEFNIVASDAWTNINLLTVNKGLFHFLHWRTTATRVMDVILTTDTKYTKEVSSLAGNLWEQIREMSWNQIYARPGVNAQGQLYIQVHPQLVPNAGRGWPTVMDITKKDWSDSIDIDRVIVNPVSAVTLSGVAVDASGNGTPYFSMSPGHAYPRYGALEVQDNLLLSDQSQSNVLAGLYRAWRNNKYPAITIPLVADVRLIDCFPQQKCTTTISAADTPRGFAYSGGLIPVAITVRQDPLTGHATREVIFEAETFESQAVTHTVPGEGDRSTPPTPPLPEIPDFPPIFPGVGTPTPEGPKKVLFYDTVGGLIYTENFNEALPTYYQVNNGLSGPVAWGSTVDIYKTIHKMFVCPNGAVYVWYDSSMDNFFGGWDSQTGLYFFVARAPNIGGTFSVVVDPITLGRPTSSNRIGVNTCAYNPLVPETVMIVVQNNTSGNCEARVGSAGSYATGYTGLPGTGGGSGMGCGLTYGFGKWLYTRQGAFHTLSPDGTTATPGTLSGLALDAFDGYTKQQVRASATGKTFHSGDTVGAKDLYRGDNNLSSGTWLADATFSFIGLAVDDTGALLMGRRGGKGKSSDYGASWAALPSLPVGSWRFEYAGPGTNVASSRWIAYGATIRYSPDFGTTWINKDSPSLLAINPFPSLALCQVVER